MEARYQLYKKLQQQIDSVMPILKGAEFYPRKVKIGKIEVEIDAFSKMTLEFQAILHSKCEDKFNKIKTNCIPISLVNTNIFLKEIQVTMNEVRKEQIKSIYHEEEER